MITKRGIVSGTKMTGTVTVTVHRHRSHSLYRKQYRMSTKFLVDPAGFDVGVGDEVEMTECRPISKRKYFKITKIIKAAPRTDEIQEEEGVEEAMHRVKEDKKDAKDPKDSNETDTSLESFESSTSFESSSQS